MNTAEMIEERKLRQGFILATLISTIAGTFITGINLYDRLVEQRRQKKLDKGQNKRIKELEQRLNETEDEKKRIQDRGRRERRSDAEPDFRNSLEFSKDVIQREYDRYYAHMGPIFAQVDREQYQPTRRANSPAAQVEQQEVDHPLSTVISQTRIQSQIILLQGSLIKLLEEALLSGKPPDISSLYNTSEFARQGSIRTLRDQHQRLLQAAAPLQRRRPIGPVRRTSSTPSLRGSSSPRFGLLGLPPPKDHSSPPRQARPSLLPLGRGAAAHQRAARQLRCRGAFVSRLHRVRRCGRRWRWARRRFSSGLEDRERSGRLRARSPGHDSYGARDLDEVSEAVVVRTYLLTRRFVFKCHREGPGYACYLCFRYRDRDTLCKSEEGLVSHVTSGHSMAEYDGDMDIKELKMALPCR